MNAVQTSRRHGLPNRIGTQAQPEKLLERDDVMLARGKLEHCDPQASPLPRSLNDGWPDTMSG